MRAIVAIAVPATRSAPIPTTAARNRNANEALVEQLGKCFGGRGGVDRVVRGELARGRHSVSGRELAGGDHVSELVRDLLVYGFTTHVGNHRCVGVFRPKRKPGLHANGGEDLVFAKRLRKLVGGELTNPFGDYYATFSFLITLEYQFRGSDLASRRAIPGALLNCLRRVCGRGHAFLPTFIADHPRSITTSINVIYVIVIQRCLM